MAVIKYKSSSGEIQKINIPITQVASFPEATEKLKGVIFQYIGEDTADYKNGYFYKCIIDESAPSTKDYSKWIGTSASGVLYPTHSSMYVYTDYGVTPSSSTHIYSGNWPTTGELTYTGDYNVPACKEFTLLDGTTGFYDDVKEVDLLVNSTITYQSAKSRLNVECTSYNTSDKSEVRSCGGTFVYSTKVSREVTNYTWKQVNVQPSGGSGGGSIVSVSATGSSTDEVKASPNKHSYSTEEQEVGTWIDGKPIYEITIVLDEDKSVSKTWNTIYTFTDSVKLIEASNTLGYDVEHSNYGTRIGYWRIEDNILKYWPITEEYIKSVVVRYIKITN